MTFSSAKDSFFLHPSKFFGQGTAFKVQVICKLLAIKGDIEFLCSFLQGYGIEIGHDPSTDCLLSSMKASSGKNEVFSGGYHQKILNKLIVPGLWAL